MNNREFIELLNLYVDHEISPEDSLRLEAEVLSNPGRRKVYDQYCRMQKACALLSDRLQEGPQVSGEDGVAAFPAQARWGFAPFAGALAAAAACLLLVVGLRQRSRVPAAAPALAAAAPAAPRAELPAVPASSEAMKPVFLARSAPGEADRLSGLGQGDSSQQLASLSWIGNLHMTPVYTTQNPDFQLAPKADLKATVINDPQGDREDAEPAEMTAFRFQR